MEGNFNHFLYKKIARSLRCERKINKKIIELIKIMFNLHKTLVRFSQMILLFFIEVTNVIFIGFYSSLEEPHIELTK